MAKSRIVKVQELIWVEIKRIVRARYKHVCFTCNRPVEGTNMQTGHFIPKSVCGAYLKYDLRNLRLQCYNCNINLGGNGAIFYKNMVKKEGQEYVDKLFKDKQKSIKALDHYEKQLLEYKLIKK
jgi:5-methylcytosine-specific restriction endonuclease McrA